jgi:hypothetical protein
MSTGFRSALWLLGIAVPSETSTVEAVRVSVARGGSFGAQLAPAAISGGHGVLASLAPLAGHFGAARADAPAAPGHSGSQRPGSALAAHRGRLHD